MRYRCYICKNETTSNLKDNDVIIGIIICDDCTELAHNANLLEHLISLQKNEKTCYKCPDCERCSNNPIEFEE